jgi:hypothetical protein
VKGRPFLFRPRPDAVKTLWRDPWPNPSCPMPPPLGWSTTARCRSSRLPNFAAFTSAGELTHEEIEKGQNDPEHHLKMHKEPDPIRRTKGPRYTPVSKRQDKPDGIAWILRNHPEVTDGAIGKLIGTTRTTIAALRERSHWNMANIQPKDPVTLGLTTQRELDAAVAKAAKAAGMAAPTDTRLEGDRAALIVELRAEREQHHRDAEAALAAAEAGEPDTSDEIVPGIKDPFKRQS